MMSIIDNVVRANRKYSQRHDPKFAERPAPKIAVVTCMDPRLSNLPDILGLPHADIDVIRTGGPAVPVEHTREQIGKVRSHPWIAKEVPVRGFVFDMETGLLTEVHAVLPV